MAGRSSENTNECIALIGFRGCGKTTVGRELAGLLGGSRIDTDELIVQRAGRSIAEIFATEGELGFRRREAEVIRQVFSSPPDIVSVGGGAVLDEANVGAIRAAATVVWLTAPAEVLWRRISSDAASDVARPPLTGRPGLAEVERLLDERAPLYARAADHVVDTAGLTSREVALEVNRFTDPV